MSRLRSLGATVACAAAVVVTAPALPSTLPASAAAAEPRHRAAVIVDTGQEVRRVCVRFDEESLSGAEILRRAGVDPVFTGYGSMGEAVCSLCGVGCPSDNCFCDRSRFWAYSRAEAGRTTFTRSSVGASSTKVGDGDVEGWRWGSGAPPPFASVEFVCGEGSASQPGATSTTSTSAAGRPGAAPPPATTGTPAPSTTHQPTPADATTTTVGPAGSTDDTTTTTAAAEPTDDEPVAAAGSRASRPSPEPEEQGSSAPALLVLVAAVGGLGGWWATLRRRRRA